MTKNKILKLLIGITLIIGSITTFYFKYLNENKVNQKEEQEVRNYIRKINEETIKENESKEENNSYENINYIGVLEIPKLGLRRGLVDVNSRYNNVRYNVQILKESTMPDVEKGNLILAAHSGNTRVSFFNTLKNLSLDDKVNIYYDNKKYTYKMVKSYEIEKTGYANIVRDKSKTTLTLITCKTGTNYQLVIICELIESE